MSSVQRLEELYDSVQKDLVVVDTEIRAALTDERPEITAMTERALGYGGKRLRPALVLLIGRAAGGITPQHQRLGAVVEMVHLATLVHDDVIDEADLRRQRETVNAACSNYEAVLLGDILFARSIHLLGQIGDQRSLLGITKTVSTLCEGELLQNRHRRNPDLDDDLYERIVFGKTASLYAAACELAAHLSGAPEPVVEGFRGYGRELGLAFQIADDGLDLEGSEADVGKTLGTDLGGGKVTLPMMLWRDARRAADDDAALELFRRVIGGEAGPDQVEELRAAIVSSGAVRQAKDRARSHLMAALDQVRPHLDSGPFGVLEAIAAFVVARNL